MYHNCMGDRVDICFVSTVGGRLVAQLVLVVEGMQLPCNRHLYNAKVTRIFYLAETVQQLVIIVVLVRFIHDAAAVFVLLDSYW